jgi:hypothetical protein
MNGSPPARVAPRATSAAKMVESRAAPVMIEDLLRSEYGRRFYGDGAPRWREGRNGNPSSTADQAAHQRDLLGKALRRDRGTEAITLAGKLTTCSSRRRCLSGACPICGRALQRMCVVATRNLFDDHGGEMLAVNVVMRTGWIELGDLIDDDIFDKTRRRLRRALQDVNVPAFGGFDISLNEHETEEFAPYWAPHAFILVPSRPLRRREARFRERFLGDAQTRRPIFIEDFDGRRAGRAYAVKPDFCGRVTLLPRLRADGSRSTFGTRTKPIWGPQRVELALALDRAGLAARLFLCGYELIAPRGDVEIVRVPPLNSSRGIASGRGHVDRRPRLGA